MYSLSDYVLKELECPACKVQMEPPIRMCGAGHNICDSCKSTLTNCVLCNSEFGGTRNLIAENLKIMMETATSNEEEVPKTSTSTKESINKSLYVNILIQLKCPHCTQYMITPPIKMCINGHSICNKCYEILNECPVCGGPLLMYTRNWTVESLSKHINFPCRYSRLGCKKLIGIDQIKAHEDDCPNKLYKCPMFGPQLEECPWNCCLDGLRKHLRRLHGRFYKEVNGSLSVECACFGSCGFFQFVIYTMSELFLCVIRIKSDVMYGYVQYIGPKSRASQYRYGMSFGKLDNSDKISVDFETNNVTETVNDILVSKKCLLIDRKALDKFFNQKSEFRTNLKFYMKPPTENLDFVEEN